MKTAFLTVTLLFLSAIASSDVVELKSGRKVQCESAIEDAGKVQCKIGKSTMSFAKAQVLKVTKSTFEPAKTQTSEPAIKEKTAVHNPADEIDRMKRAHRYTMEGALRMKERQYSAAIDRFMEAYDTYRNKDTITNLAMAHYYASNFDSAQSYFQELLTIHPDDTLALNALGIISAMKGDVNSAENYWRHSYSIKADPVLVQYIQSLSQMRVPAQGSVARSLNRSEMERTISSYEQDSDTHFQIRYDGGSVNPVLLREISRSLEENYDKLRFDFEVEPSNTLEVILYPRKDFRTITGAPDWSGGFNDGRIHLPVGGLDSVNQEVTRIIVHELTHSFLSTKMNGEGPIWLQEGIAQYMDGTRLPPSLNSGLSGMAKSGTLPSLKNLSSSFMQANSNQASMYYAASLSFIEFLMGRYRFDEMNDLLKRLGSGASTEDAVRQAFGNDLSGLEEAWRQSL